MFHKLKKATPQKDLTLSLIFIDGSAKLYDMKPIINKIPQFEELSDIDFFSKAKVDTGGYGVVWNDEIDISSEELWVNGR